MEIQRMAGKIFGLIAVVSLVACGGGGGSGSSSGGGGSTGVPLLSLFAGNAGGNGDVDGTGPIARFSSPQGMVMDGAGNLYVSDTNNHLLRKIVIATGEVTTLAGKAGVRGSADGTGAAASFNYPQGITIDASGNLYVAESQNHVIRKITPAGVVSTLAGTAGTFGSADGTGAAASFNGPQGVASDASGNLYVADTGNRVIRKITPAGDVTTLAGAAGVSGSADGTGTAARFISPISVVADAADNLYVADNWNFTIRKIDASGAVTTLAGAAGVSGNVDGTGAAARFSMMKGIAIDAAGNLYVGQTNGLIRKIDAAGAVTTLAGTAGVCGSTDGALAQATFCSPYGIAVDDSGNVFVADSGKSVIRKISAAGMVTTLAGEAAVSGSTDGVGPAATFAAPADVVADAAGNLYVADSANNIIRKITPVGAVSTLAGTAGVVGSADGTGAAASFNSPMGITIDASGNVYVADSGNTTIRKITPAGVVSTLAGTAGVGGSTDGTGAAASFSSPQGITNDASGNLYVADNNIIRKITPAGVVSTLAGSAAVWGSADGAGAAASFNGVQGITITPSGNLYVADYGNGTLRKISPAGVVTTFAGTAGVWGSADGTGSAASFECMQGVDADASGNLYVADSCAHTIRKITPAGAVTTVVGRAYRSGFIPGALPGYISQPGSIAISGGTLYFTTNNGIAKVSSLP